MLLRQTRKNRVSTVLLILLIILPVITGCSNVLSKPDYIVDKYDIHVQVQPDGKAIMQEKILLSFSEDSRELDLFINRLRNARLEDLSIRVSENNPDPEQLELPESESNILFQELQPADPDASAQSPMTWLQTDLEKSVRLRMSLILAAENQYQIVLKYSLGELVRKNHESAYIRQQLGAFPENTQLNNLNITYYLPYQLEETDSWLNMVGETTPDKSSMDVDRWTSNWSQLKSSDFPESILIMPAEYFEQVALSPNLATRSVLIEEAQNRISQADRSMFWHKSVEALVYFMLILALVFIILIYFIFDREGIASFKERYYLPKTFELPPAVMSLVLRSGKPAGLIMSTLLDLVRRKELRLEGQVFTWLHPDRNDYVGFKAYEIFLLQWIFEKVNSSSNTVSAIKMRDYARNKSTAEEFRGYYEQFTELLGEEMTSYGLYDEGKSYYGRLIGQALAAAYVVMAILSSVYLMSFVGALLLIPAMVFFVYALSLRHLTSFGNEQYARGLAFRRYLSRFYELDRNEVEIELPGCDEAVDLLPYAAALNRTKLFMRQLIMMARDSSVECGAGLLETYQQQTIASWQNDNGSRKSDSSKAAKAAAVEQIRLLGRDLVTMESTMAAGFYMSSSFHLMEDH